MQAILTAGTVYIHTAFGPAAVIDAIEADRIEFFTAGPSLIDMLVAEIRRRERADLSHLREIAYGQGDVARPARCRASAAAATPSPPESAGSSGRIRVTFMDRPTAARTSPGAGPARTTTVLELRRIGSMLAPGLRLLPPWPGTQPMRSPAPDARASYAR